MSTNYSVPDTLANTWQLFNLNEGFNEQKDLAKKYPGKLKELQVLFDQEARKNRLYPLITWDDVLEKTAKEMQRLLNETK
ncbi:hypothetical protein [Dyadobacter sp. 32]|uniref:hypothetical protein n=1 Tax=Dyadobacter sp. 32 TaxID=538966 RepID=UPI0011EFCCF9